MCIIHEDKNWLAIEIPIKTVNLVAIVIFSRRRCGLSICSTRYLIAMAMADLLVIITEIIMRRLNSYYFLFCFLNIVPVCSIIAVLIRAAVNCSVWFTVTFSFDRFVAICCQKLMTKYCTAKNAIVVLATTCALLCLKNVPFYFVFEPGLRIDRVSWDCYIKPSYFTEPGWVRFHWFDMILTPALPFALILLLNALTVRHILQASQLRKGLRGHRSPGDHRDPEVESRRKSVVLLFTVSGNFIILWLVIVIDFFYDEFTGKEPLDYTNSEYIFHEVGIMLLNLSCCTNTFIYGVTQSKFREQLRSMVTYPLTAIARCI
ncbi:probable G-protein coupled receptor 139 [Chiloscyllium plagiosum]|uniref:probable G-protein coupled receptor 139 n=1 Tax=Chiloscyllium plagiosum TaxID=36176 RepID=UPI001CB80258|nr:probable G-protein coupled receptor 139 [Chiloscyllium plagiosum]